MTMKKTYFPPTVRIVIVRRGFHLLLASGTQDEHVVNPYSQGSRITLGDAAEDGVSQSRPTPVYTFHTLWDYDD